MYQHWRVVENDTQSCCEECHLVTLIQLPTDEHNDIVKRFTIPALVCLIVPQSIFPDESLAYIINQNLLCNCIDDDCMSQVRVR